MESALYRAQRKTQPRIPESPDALAAVLPDATQYNIHFREVVSSGAGNTALIFFGDFLIPLLPQIHHLSFDGTFQTVPKIFLQLFTIMAVTSSSPHSFPVIFVLMSSKTQELYEAVISKVKDLFPELSPQTLMSDFELSSRNAMEISFPTAVLSGCVFHYAQSIWKRLQKLGLSKTYKDNLAFKRHARKLMNLPHLPPQHIVEEAEVVFSELDQVGMNQTERSLAHKLHKYIKKFWFRTITPEKLSVFSCTRATNNDLEAYHSQLKARIRTVHPNPWTFLGELNNLVQDVALDVQRTQNGLHIARPLKRSVANNITRRNELRQKLTSGAISPAKFLKSMSHSFDTYLSLQNRESSSSDDSDSDDDQGAGEPSNCPICLQPRATTYAVLPCFHAFCGTCSQRLVDEGQFCAVCRANIISRQQVFI